MGEFEEHPDVCGVACRRPIAIALELEAYLEALREKGLASGDWCARPAAAMLMGTLFADAMGRECMSELYSYAQTDAVREYVRLFLRAIGARERNH